MRPILAEQYANNVTSYYAVAVVKKGSIYRSFADLKGAKSCYAGFGTAAGYFSPIHQLLKQKLIKKGDCPYAKALSEFFSGGVCLPGYKDFGWIYNEKYFTICGYLKYHFYSVESCLFWIDTNNKYVWILGFFYLKLNKRSKNAKVLQQMCWNRYCCFEQ